MSGGMAVMSTIGSILGDISGKVGAREQGRAIRQQAAEADIQADIEELNGKITENDLRDRLLRTLASNAAAAAASGVAGPSMDAANFDDIDQATRAMDTSRLESMLKVGALRRTARGLYRQGKYAIITGSLNSAATALGGNASTWQGFGGGQTAAASSGGGSSGGGGKSGTGPG